MGAASRETIMRNHSMQHMMQQIEDDLRFDTR